MNSGRKRVLVGSAIHQKPIVLREFLHSLIEIDTEHIDIDFYFIDDNQDKRSKRMLEDFKGRYDDACTVSIVPSHRTDAYVRTEKTHFWNEQLIWKVAEFKNSIIEYALLEGYDYLFLIDSDLLLHPNTIYHLTQTDKEIISEVFWTKWQPNTIAQPQVWLKDEYTQHQSRRGEELSSEELNQRLHQFYDMLKKPGVYPVGGLGACTLISRKAMAAGVNFSQIYNLSFWGEDRHFCIRAVALGFTLYVDTHYPAYHIYRDSELAGVQAFKLNNQWINNQDSPFSIKKGDKLTLSMIMRNESSRYLEKALMEHRKYIDEAVIIDDGSTDDSVKICKRVLKGIPLTIIQNEQSKFSNEIDLRKQQWEEVIKTNPDWILNMDADEIFENAFESHVGDLINQSTYDLYSFRLYDFWNDLAYREDEYWKAHLYYRPFLLRYRPDFNYVWKETPQHSGRYPQNIFQLPNAISPMRVKHFGWAKEEYRKAKYERYKQLDPNAVYGVLAQYESILDESPRLIEWVE